MHIRRNALAASILLLLQLQPTHAHAAFNLIDDPKPEALAIDPWDSYQRVPVPAPTPIRPVALSVPLYHQFAYQPAVYDPSQEPALGSVLDPLSIETAGIIEIGLSDVSVSVINKSGKNKPLPAALRAILPKGWHAKKRAEVSRKMLISWDKGWDWVTTLDDIAKDHGLAIVVDWNSQTATVFKSALKQEEPQEQEDRQEQAQTAEHDRKNVYVVSEEKWQEIKPKPTQAESKGLIDLPPSPPEKPIIATELGKDADKATTTTSITIASPSQQAKYEPALHLSASRKMSESLETWAKEIGWNLIWDAKVDYPISVNTTFFGSADDIITQFGDAIVHSHLPLHVDVYKLNKVIRVSNQ